MDPCHTLVPGRPKIEFDQKMASFGKAKRWMSDDARDDSRNLRSVPYTNAEGEHKVPDCHAGNNSCPHGSSSLSLGVSLSST